MGLNWESSNFKCKALSQWAFLFLKFRKCILDKHIIRYLYHVKSYYYIKWSVSFKLTTYEFDKLTDMANFLSQNFIFPEKKRQCIVETAKNFTRVRYPAVLSQLHMSFIKPICYNFPAWHQGLYRLTFFRNFWLLKHIFKLSWNERSAKYNFDISKFDISSQKKDFSVFSSSCFGDFFVNLPHISCHKLHLGKYIWHCFELSRERKMQFYK